MQRLLPLAAAVLALSACAPATVRDKGVVIVAPIEKPGWHALVSAEDEQRIDHLPESWRSIIRAIPARSLRLVTNEGDLLVPDAARDHPTPPPGSYRCRLVKLSAPSPAATKRREAPVRSFPDFFCYVRGEKDNELSFTKQTGTELPGGWLHHDGDRRLILVGARQREVGNNSLAYGAEPDRDVVGVVERIGPFRWRLTLPWRGTEAGLDIYDLTPVPQSQQAKEPRPAATDGAGTEAPATGNR